MKSLFAVFSLCWLIATQAPAYAEDGVTSDPRVSIRTIEPARDVGYSVGDTLTRTVILEVDKPYVLLETSLPVAGTQKKRQNQEQGIETHAVTLKKSTGPGKNIYTLHLTYQVFTRGVTAKPSALPPEFIKFGGKGENFSVRIPSWSFRISPLAVFGSVVVEKDMSGYRGPLLLDSSRTRQLLWGLLVLCTLSVLGLFYVLGSSTWLPHMGGPFARAGRDLKKLANTEQGLQQGVARLHEAFNKTAGSSVFDAASFLRHKPSFAPVAADIERFFALSRAVFFEPNATHGISGEPLTWLRSFCRRCRDCERGLK
jgi:hypothetical protein